nr:MAG TPA: hypothetical protein [Caudoviricetes sp.]
MKVFLSHQVFTFDCVGHDSDSTIQYNILLRVHLEVFLVSSIPKHIPIPLFSPKEDLKHCREPHILISLEDL